MSHQREQHTVSTSRSSGSTDKQGARRREHVLWDRMTALLHGKGMPLGTCLLLTFLDGHVIKIDCQIKHRDK